MEYLTVEDAKEQTGLRLVLTKGVPGPWSEAAKAIFKLRQVEFVPVEQKGGGKNPELVQWTNHRNAPIALYNNEAPRVRWLELLDLAERLGSGPSLVPEDRTQRMFMIGLINEIAGECGFAWNARLLMLNMGYQMQGADAVAKNPMYADYLFDPDTVNKAKEQVESFLADMSAHISTHKSQGQENHYLIGDNLTAADVYWAYFSNMLQALPPEQNPMPNGLRQSWAVLAQSISGYDASLIEQRDKTFAKHLDLPLEF
jgi:hypothetical protein